MIEKLGKAIFVAHYDNAVIVAGAGCVVADRLMEDSLTEDRDI